MRYIKNHKQQPLFDPWSHLSPKRRQMLENTWPGLFKEHLLTELPVHELGKFFSSDFGRPTKDLSTVLGVLILQQTMDLTDEEAVSQLAFNIQWHYALDITEESDSAKYLCPKTLWNMRSILMENALDALLFNVITGKLAMVFNVNTDQQRIDSVHIKSNMQRLGRIGIFSKAIHKFLKNLKRQHKDLFDTVAEDLVGRYLPEKSLACFSMVKPSQTGKTLERVSNDLYDLIEAFKDQAQVISMHSYQLLQRILKDQCELSSSDDDNRVTVKAPKNIPSDSLQNPSDPDATYSGHKGQGYQAQVMETYTTDEEKKDETLNLITHVDLQGAHESDAGALIPAIEATEARNLKPEELLTDTLYGSDDNIEQSKMHHVDVLAPVMGTEKTECFSLKDFQTDKKGHVTACPRGHHPIQTKKKKTRFCAIFELSTCSSCPHEKNCPVKQGKKGYYLRYTDKQLRIARRRAYQQTEEFKERYRWRSGVEATMSELDRRTGLKHLRVRGFKAVRYCVNLKALGLNILRAAVVKSARQGEKIHLKTALDDYSRCLYRIKERFIKKIVFSFHLYPSNQFALNKG